MIKDKLDRQFEYLRISVTDKCNFRCIYCMPKEIFGSKHQFLKKNELLTYEEIIEVAKTLKPFGLKNLGKFLHSIPSRTQLKVAFRFSV